MKWKRLISGLCAVCVAVTGSFLMLPGDVLDSAILAQAAEIIGEGTCGDHLTWTLDSEGTVTVSGTGYMDDNGRYNNKAWRKYGCINSVRRVIIEDGVTSIGAEAFYQCTNLTEISIPESVKSISYNVFKECTGLKEINIPEGVQSIGSNAFNGCTQLTKVILSDSVTSIGAWAFWECKELKSISLPKHLTWIPGCMFSSCTSLAEITIPEGVTAIGDYAFSGCTGLAEITIPDSVKSIGEQAFSGCSSLQSIKIPDSVTRIGTKAFSGCTSLAEITIPDSVTSIGENAFENTPWLAEAPFIITNGILVSAPNSAGSVTVPEGVTAIGESAFANCTDLTEVILPDSVTSIGKKAFSGCTGLAEITLPEGLTSIGESAFSDCKNLTSISLPESLTAIEIHAFENCRRLKEITIPEGITALSDYTFQNCINLTQIHLPDTLKSIGQGAFFGCRKLTDISLPESVTSIGESAFSGCTGVTDITVLNKDCDISYTIDAIPEQAVIHGYSGSTAQTYAQMYGRTFISLDGSSGEENPPEPKEYYPLTVCGIPVTDVNKDDILGNGVFKYLPQSSLLVVGGTVSVSGTVIEATGSLSVYVQNFSRLTSTEQDAIVLHGDGGKVTITGSNPLTLSAPNGAGIRLGENTTLSLLSTNITIEDADCGILGTEKNADLQITHCGVSFKKIKTCAASVSGEILLSYNKKNDAVGIVRREDGVCFYDQTNDCPAADFDILRLPFPNLYDDDEYDYSGEDGYIEVYPVSIGGIHVTEANCSDVLGNGVFRYDPDSDVLTVSGDVHCIDVGFQCIKNRRSVEMRIEKDSVLKTISVIDNGYSVTYVTISGSGGKLTVDSMFLRTYYRVEFRDLDLTLGGSLDGWYTDNTLADEGFWGTPGYCNELRITNSRIELHGTITCFYKLTLTDCHIAEPVGGYYIPAEYIVVEESQDDDPGKGKLVGGNMVDPTGKHDYILILPDNAPETTTTTTTETTTTTTGTTTTTAAETTAETTSAEASKYFAPITEMGRMAEIDYMQKHGSAPAKFETEEPEDGTVRITLSDADGNVLDTYTLDPETGIGTDSTGREVNLPQTGNNSPAQAAAAAAAAGLTLAGAFLLICACRRKEDIL